MGRIALPVLALVVVILAHRAHSLPLSAKNRWIVDATNGQRVKLRCVNWPGHMPAVIPEGLNHKPVADIAGKVASLGFNCVRLTWSIHMVMKPYYRNLTVADSLSSLNLTNALEGVRKNNPQILDRPVIEAFDAVVRALGDAGVMVILDNHVSKPMWCCGMDDGNGFFGDHWFDPEEWVQALQTMANRFKGVSPVIGMSMRNELRGHNSSVPVWYKYMTRGAQTIHATNPDVLVIVSDLNYDSDLIFLKTQPFPIANDKIVFEAHWYAFSEGKQEEWVNKNPSWYCPGVTNRFDNRIGYVNHWAMSGSTEVPLFISEFGYDQRGVDASGNMFLPCFFAYAVDTDIDWAIWALQGSYYWREGRVDFEETYGVLDWSWDHAKDPDFIEKFSLLQEMILDPSSNAPNYQIIYHPLSGKCLSADANSTAVELQECKRRSQWSYGGDGTQLKLLGSDICLKLVAEGQPLMLSRECDVWRGVWSSRLQLTGGANAGGNVLCMDASADGSAAVVATQCRCVNGETCGLNNPQTQWFKIVNSNIALQ